MSDTKGRRASGSQIRSDKVKAARNEGVNLSRRTITAAQKAAASEGKALDEWADEVLATAAGASKPRTVEAILRDISRKVDQIIERQGLGERINEQVTSAAHELGKSLGNVGKKTRDVFGKVRTRTNTAVEVVAERARGTVDQRAKPESSIGRSGVPNPRQATSDAPPAKADKEGPKPDKPRRPISP